MKKITFRKDEKNPQYLEGVKNVLSQVLGNSPQKPLSVDEMRKRVRVIDILEQMEDGVMHLEDSDHGVLKESVSSFPWSQANRALVNMIDDIEKAESVSFLKIVKPENPTTEADTAAAE